MRCLVLALVLVSAATAAHAQGNIPDLKGTWAGKGKAIVFGNNLHHPGSQTAANPPRVRDLERRGPARQARPRLPHLEELHAPDGASRLDDAHARDQPPPAAHGLRR